MVPGHRRPWVPGRDNLKFYLRPCRVETEHRVSDWSLETVALETVVQESVRSDGCLVSK